MAGKTQAKEQPRLDKLDLVKLRPDYFKAYAEPDLVTLPIASYLAIFGEGAPEGDVYQAALGGLYSMAYTLKFAFKAQERDFKVAPLQGQWWSDELGGKAVEPEEFLKIDREKWKFRCMIMMPDSVKKSDVKSAFDQLEAKKSKKPEAREQLEAAGKVELVRLKEGKCARILHTGPYSEEVSTVSRLHRFIVDSGLWFEGLHHEIYLGDPRRTKPERLKTVIRYPVVKAKP